MAQGFEDEAISAFNGLGQETRDTLIMELSRTGCREQYAAAPGTLLGGAIEGPAICVYYSPALLQKAGPADIDEALQLLAAVFEAARELFPLSQEVTSAESTAIVRIDQLKILTPGQIIDTAPWYLEMTTHLDAVAQRKDVAQRRLSLFGAALSHFEANCLYGYGYGVLYGPFPAMDKYCGISPKLCPPHAPEAEQPVAGAPVLQEMLSR